MVPEALERSGLTSSIGVSMLSAVGRLFGKRTMLMLTSSGRNTPSEAPGPDCQRSRVIFGMGRVFTTQISEGRFQEIVYRYACA